jgi:hypothetical protein
MKVEVPFAELAELPFEAQQSAAEDYEAQAANFILDPVNDRYIAHDAWRIDLAKHYADAGRLAMAYEVTEAEEVVRATHQVGDSNVQDARVAVARITHNQHDIQTAKRAVKRLRHPNGLVANKLWSEIAVIEAQAGKLDAAATTSEELADYDSIFPTIAYDKGETLLALLIGNLQVRDGGKASEYYRQLNSIKHPTIQFKTPLAVAAGLRAGSKILGYGTDE